MRLGTVLRSLAVATATTGLSLVAGPALAGVGGGSGSSCGGGYCVQVHYSGTAAPSGGGGGAVVASVPPTCWYEPWASTAEGLKYYQDWMDDPLYTGKEMIRAYGSQEEFEKAAKEHPDSTWYQLHCSVPMDDPKALDYAGEKVSYYWGVWPRMTRLIGPGQTPPPPAVDVEVLRDAAYDSMQIPDPEVRRNPEIVGTGNATLVNLPTYFWADNARATWDITASVGPISATVVATSEGYTLSSTSGDGASCSNDQFALAWSAQTDGQGCSLTFGRANRAGFDVTVAADWSATWTGTPTPTEPQALPGKVTTSTETVPVVESQTLVTDIG